MRSIIISLLVVSGFHLQLFSQQVNGFTGGFSYGLPLLNVPSNKGNGIPVSAGYNAGIGVGQPASEIGLGWNLNAGGAIFRTVSGIPDDCNHCLVFNENNQVFVSENGTLHTPSDADLYRTGRNMDSLNFMFPDYDFYSVSGPGIGGNLTPFIFDYQMFTKNDSDRYVIDATYYGKNRTPQFHFNGDFADTLISRHYSVTPTSSTTPFALPNSTVSGLCYNNNEPYLGKSVNGPSITAQNYDISTNRLGSANYVEYFTNAQIAAIGGTVNIPGYIDFQATSTRTSTADYPAAGVGAFRITNPYGYVYHYSQPVYVIKTESHTYPLGNDYSVPSFSATLSSYTTATGQFTWTLNSDAVTKRFNSYRYAYQWLLTAITGPDYEDSNNNHLVDDADKGYWVSFDYKPWSKYFPVRSPHYGFNYYFGIDEATKTLPAYEPTNGAGPGSHNKLSGKQGIVNITYEQICYLNKIKTNSHTAIFVRDIRKDEVCGDTSTTVSGTTTPVPQLKVSRIILFKNDRLDSVISSAPTSTFTESSYPSYAFSNTTNSSNYFFTENWYSTNLSSYVKNRILKNIEFDQDYSLCRNYQGNSGVSSYPTSVVTPPATTQSNIAVGTYSTSGKLTLNKITSYDIQNVKITPSIMFDYNASVATDNPDFDPRKTDNWGFYKSDITSNGYSSYTSQISKDYTDAWSLRQITEIMGGTTSIEYESNSYTKVLDKTDTSGYRGATFIFPIRTLSVTGGCTSNCTNLNCYLEESTNPNELLPLISGTITGLSQKACIPLGEMDETSYPDPYSYLSFIYFGNIAYTGTVSPFTLTSIDGLGSQTAGKTDCFSVTSQTYQPATGDALYPYEYLGISSNFTVSYSGNGYLLFQTPTTYEVYGGGIRVKKLKKQNGSLETYTKEYTYEGGVASAEADRFNYPELVQGCGASAKWLDKLQPFNVDKHMLTPMIGYSKVTTKNLGQINASNGALICEYITRNKINGSAVPNYSVVQSAKTVSGNYVKYFECLDEFSPYWGLKKEERVLDINNNMISKTSYEFETTDQGAIVENFDFRENIGAKTSDVVCIMRHYPSVLKTTTSYGPGSFSQSEVIRRDEVTGEIVTMRTTGQNGSTSLASRLPAFRAFAAMGPKSVDAGHTNCTAEEAYSFTAVDTSITPVTSGIGSSFLHANAHVFTNQPNVRLYDGSGTTFSISTGTLAYWNQNLNYQWAGVPGSIDDYGLYKRSELTSNPFNFSAPTTSNSAHWRFTSENSLYDDRHRPLEMRMFNDRFNAVKYGYNDDYVLATASNCNYASFTYSGFETKMPNTAGRSADGEILVSTINATLVPTATIAPHSGYSCLATTSTGGQYLGIFSNNGSYNTGVLPGRTYRAIVWISTGSNSGSYMSVSVTGSVSGTAYSQAYSVYANDPNAITIGNWKRLSLEFKVPPDIVASSSAGINLTLVSGGGTAYFDDLLFYPVEASVKGNVYNSGTGRLVAEIGQLGYATFYTYDEAGRVLETRQEIPDVGVKLVKRNTYHYARSN